MLHFIYDIHFTTSKDPEGGDQPYWSSVCWMHKTPYYKEQACVRRPELIGLPVKEKSFMVETQTDTERRQWNICAARQKVI